MVLADAGSFGKKPTVLDIGCGKGFDLEVPLQRSIARVAGRYIGVEPDESVVQEPFFSEVHHCILEEAHLPPASIHLAFAVMVLEHIPDPARFWRKVHEVLVDGGIFLGFTVDARHWFPWASLLADRLRLRDLYLTRLHGKRGEDRYENYPVYYRTNTPAAVHRHARAFRRFDFQSFSAVGQSAFYFPKWMRPLADRLDAWSIGRGMPGSILAVRLVK
jgi:SAM-dependent methyltransferase